MLHRSEFNGKKDVLHFKLLQAAINENNAKKAYEQNMENLNENSNVSKRYGVINNNERKDTYNDARDNQRFQFKGNQYYNFDDENNNGYEPRIKKSRILSEHSSHGSNVNSKKREKNLSAITKFKPASSYLRQPSNASSLSSSSSSSSSKQEKLRKISHESHRKQLKRERKE